MDWIEQLEALAKKLAAPNWQVPPNEEATKMAFTAYIRQYQSSPSPYHN